MSYRSIAVLADAAGHAASRLRIAATLAAHSGAVLDGAFVKPRFMSPLAVGGAEHVPPTTLQALADAHEGLVAREAETAKAAFDAALNAAGARGEWTMLEDDGDQTFVSLARCADLVVYPKDEPAELPLPPADLAAAAATPILLIPKTPHDTGPGRRVLVAWNASPEAASALRGAWPLLEAADVVEVLMVDPGPEVEAFIGKAMVRRGVKARIAVDRSSDAGAGELIRRHAEDLTADLVVMGLYGHSRLRELVLGGASASMLKQEIFPLLVAS
jgi:nucleotide-binding universal stress UspA family protein